MATTSQVCTFQIDNLWCGVDVRRVQEVLCEQKLTCIPLAPVGAEGLINLRGQIVMAVDLRKRLGLPASQLKDGPMNVVLRTADGPVSLLVDRVGDVVEVTEDSFVPMPETLDETTRETLLGAYRLPDSLLLLLNTEKLLQQLS